MRITMTIDPTEDGDDIGIVTAHDADYKDYISASEFIVALMRYTKVLQDRSLEILIRKHGDEKVLMAFNQNQYHEALKEITMAELFGDHEKATIIITTPDGDK